VQGAAFYVAMSALCGNSLLRYRETSFAICHRRPPGLRLRTAHIRRFSGSRAFVPESNVKISRTVLIELQGTSICINVVNPGPTRTEMRADAFPGEDPSALKTPEGIAPMFVELCLPSSTAHGQLVNADEWLAQRSATAPAWYGSK
jgi:hypothetical protein